MNASDVLKLLSILLAIIAFISEKNRNFVFLKFSKSHLLLLVVAFFYIHFLLSYNWWRNKLNFVITFEWDGWPPTSAWAYIFSIIILFWLVWRIFWANFPIDNKEKLIAYYESLLQKNDTIFLSELIEKFHLSQIVEYLNKKKDILVKDRSGFDFIDRQKYIREFDSAIKTPSLIYGNLIYENIILNDKFIDDVARVKPYLFTDFISEMDHPRTKDSDFVNRYLKVLTKFKNRDFFREIRGNQNLAEHNSYRIEKERAIIYA